MTAWATLDRLWAERDAREQAALGPRQLARRKRFAEREARKIFRDLRQLERQEARGQHA